ncbi:MAG: cbb3-type cytochrome c oxidase subunit II [Verrucomicrobia bacterium]|nr:cbb3-type cytochrome c oxidase subunit II [Verrucomicrobiota bacterium]
MNRAPLIFLGVFAALAFSWAGLVLAPQIQIGGQGQKLVQGGDTLYPARRSGMAQQGAAVYVSLGCVYCHSQQVQPREWGYDNARGWGKRRSVAQDYLFDEPVQLGARRVGPDLSNVGLRFTNETFFLEFLYNPQMHHPGSTMPPFPFLFDRRRIGKTPSPDALKLPQQFAPEAGYEVVPKSGARKLAAYLVSLQSEAPLFEAPWPKAKRTNAPPAALDTNAPPGTATNAAPATNASAAAATNAPTK